MALSTAEERLAREFGAAIKARRRASGLTQTDLAGRIGTNRRFISELESGKGTSYLGPALAAAEALGMHIRPIFSDVRPPTFKLPPL
jgi:HTH-type transcriptional regulator/antitoxin HipB